MTRKTSRFTGLLVAPVLLGALTIGGCKKDDEVNATLDMLDETTEQIVTKVKSAEDKKAGVADAQEYLDEHADELKTKITELGELRGYQVSDETAEKMASKLIENIGKVQSLEIELMAQTATDQELDAKLSKLTDTYTNVVNL